MGLEILYLADLVPQSPNSKLLRSTKQRAWARRDATMELAPCLCLLVASGAVRTKAAVTTLSCQGQAMWEWAEKVVVVATGVGVFLGNCLRDGGWCRRPRWLMIMRAEMPQLNCCTWQWMYHRNASLDHCPMSMMV